ncbi:hypothetical protein F5B22DRAFT_649243 [Xylaria bambusicola]|uniref:uncharacterized protein n=1 Tax=Xylaria bambusicola TaxID=326684 RepID=UPI0020080269|nr:uncharacterized protein F5B22DRAFT_649243 [Xylaria bambusicola]KAI0509194.1 hypothetical protein F5B22DRAFT_649243 [Xylaria bambusicola]
MGNWAHTPLKCFVGAWSIINATLTNMTTGDPVLTWHTVYPDGISVYAETGYSSLIMTANDTTQRAVRPTELELPAHSTDNIARWALVGQYSLSTGGPFELHPDKDTHNGAPLFTGAITNHITTATLPSLVGRSENSLFEFFGEDCNGHILRYRFADLLQTVYFQRLPNHNKEKNKDG